MNTEFIIGLVAVFVFGVSGTLAAAKRGMDFFGLSFLACISALGGGTVRDMLMGQYPLSWVADSRYIFTVLAAVIFTLLCKRWLIRITRVVFIADTIGIGIFTISSVQYCLGLHLKPEIAILFGVLSVFLGGMLRDVICNEIPIILRKELSASAAAAGGAVYIIFQKIGLVSLPFILIPMVIIIALRLVSHKYNWSLPTITIKTNSN
jgi:uncharacterized membrane protein YeiH